MNDLLDQLVLAPVILPLLGAGLCLAFGRFAAPQRIISIITLLAVVASACVLLVRADLSPFLPLHAARSRTPLPESREGD